MHEFCNFLGLSGPGEDASSPSALCSYIPLLFVVTPEREMEKRSLKSDLGGGMRKLQAGKLSLAVLERVVFFLF